MSLLISCKQRSNIKSNIMNILRIFRFELGQEQSFVDFIHAAYLILEVFPISSLQCQFSQAEQEN